MGGRACDHIPVCKKKKKNHSRYNADNRGVKNGSRDTAQEVQARDSITCNQELKCRWREVGRCRDGRYKSIRCIGCEALLVSGLQRQTVVPFTKRGLNFGEKDYEFRFGHVDFEVPDTHMDL